MSQAKGYDGERFSRVGVWLWSAVAAGSFLAMATIAAQELGRRMSCEGRQGWRGADFCEVRELTLAATGSLAVDAGPNGGVRVIGSDRDDVLVRAQVQSWADDEEAAREIAGEVSIDVEGVVRAEGPAGRGGSHWSVSYEILAPRRTDLELDTHNGGIAIDGVRGDLDVEAHNGGIELDGLAGRVRGRTINGGVRITLTGSTWDGDTLDVETTNGGIRLLVPDGYSARLETSTVNGSMSIDFPITIEGRIGRRVETTLGEGGPLVRVTTRNGSVRVRSYD